MIGRCKAIAHGSTALDYIFREGKLGYRLAFHNLCSREPKTIYEEMKVVSDYNSRCLNKFLRIEIGIAPKDEKRLPVSELMGIAHLFAKRMGLDNHQLVAVTHKDTNNMHIHIIANRISLYGEVYDTTFVSNKAARVAEEISREKNLTIAKEVKAKKKYQKTKASPMREQMKQQGEQWNKANQKAPDVGTLRNRNQQEGKGGQGSTMLTGARGVDKDKLLLGRASLLGG